jgi:hypothetical protein
MRLQAIEAFIQNRNVMPTTRMLAAAIIRISEPSILLRIRNIGTSWCPETLTR